MLPLIVPTCGGTAEDCKELYAARGGAGQAYAVALQPPDDRVIAVGETAQNFSLSAWDNDGTLDTGFGTNGSTSIDMSNNRYHDRATAVAVQSDGKIVVAGYANLGTGFSDFAVVRYDRNARAPDLRFTAHFGEPMYSSHASAVLVQADGKIVVGGTAALGTSDQDFGLARFTPTGSLDSTFGETQAAGKVTTDVGDHDTLFAMTTQSDGKIVAVGSSENPDPERSTDFAVVRYTSEGELDGTFDGDGIATRDFVGEEWASDVAILPDGRVAVVGTSAGDDAGDFRLALFDKVGRFIRSTATDFAGDDYPEAVAIHEDRIILAGSILLPSADGIGVAAYRFDGAVDGRFGENNEGAEVVATGSPMNIRAVTILGERLILVGSIGTSDGPRFLAFPMTTDGYISCSWGEPLRSPEP